MLQKLKYQMEQEVKNMKNKYFKNDAYGNMTDYPYELDRVRIYLYKLMKLGKKILEYNL